MRLVLISVLLAAAAAAQPAPPAWVADAVAYEIAPERFANGDRANDPAAASDGRAGGDLQGLLDRVGYLDSLGVSLVYLAPVLSGDSLRGGGAAGAYHVDPFLGPDPQGDLALLATEAAGPALRSVTAADRLLGETIGALHACGIRVALDASDLVRGPRADALATALRWMDPNGDGDPSDGVDGWRLDATAEVPDALWRDWAALVAGINPNAYMAVGAERGVLAGLIESFLYNGRPGAATFADTVIAHFLDTRGATGDARARGGRGVSTRQAARRSARAPTAAERDLRRAAVTLQMALPGLPVMVSGDEAGRWGGVGQPMVWPGSAAFDPDLLAFYRRAVALRRRDAVLRHGSLSVLAADSAAQSVAFERTLGGQRRVVAVNRSDRSQLLLFPAGAPREPLVPIFASSGDLRSIPSLVFVLEESGRSGGVGLRLPPRTAVVFRTADGPDVRPNGLHE